MDILKKFLVWGLVIFLAVVLASVFGMVHNQVSYTVGPEYFTKFKFQRFGLLDDPSPERWRAAKVGFIASRGMGIPIGFLTGLVAFIHRGPRRMLQVSIWSLGLVLAVTSMFSLGGLIYGYFATAQLDPKDYAEWFIPVDVTDLRRFLCVGYMHNASYMGGAISILAACIFHVIVRMRTRD